MEIEIDLGGVDIVFGIIQEIGVSTPMIVVLQMEKAISNVDHLQLDLERAAELITGSLLASPLLVCSPRVTSQMVLDALEQAGAL